LVKTRTELFRWLTSEAVVRGDGAVLSWYNPAHPGFPYPEAAALWLSWAAWRRHRGEPVPTPGRVARVAARLARELDAAGGTGARGRLFLFDSCLALDALARTDLRGTFPRDRILRWVDEPSPVVPEPPDSDHWSHGWGLHLLRAAGFLERAGQTLEREDLVEASRRLAERIRRRSDQEPSRYLHARAYALEGRWMLEGPVPVMEELSIFQRDDGSLPAEAMTPGPGRCDATAQAIRLWCAYDPVAFGGSISAAASWLTAQVHPDGGIRYEAGSEDRNTWAALFADQAFAWAADGEADGEWI